MIRNKIKEWYNSLPEEERFLLMQGAIQYGIVFLFLLILVLISLKVY